MVETSLEKNNIWEFVNSGKINAKEGKLHFIHGICSNVLQLKILNKKAPYLLKKSRQEKIYNNAEILFLSYGKPSYLVNKSPSPVFFYFELKNKKTLFSKSEIYALDTGAFLLNLCSYFEGVDDKENVLKDFFKDVNSSEDNIRKFVSFFYGDNKSYYTCNLTSKKNEELNFILANYLESIKALNRSDEEGNYKNEDWRISTIEMQYFDNINLVNDDVFELKYILCLNSSKAYVKKRFPKVKVKTYGLDGPYSERMAAQDNKILERALYFAGKNIVEELEE